MPTPTSGPAAVPVPSNITPVGPLTKNPTTVSPAVASVPATTPTLVPRSQIDTAPAPVTPGPSTGTTPTGNITITVPVSEAAVNITPQAVAAVSSTPTKPGGMPYSVQYNANGVFGGSGQFEWDTVNGLVKIGNSYGGYKPTDLFVQGNIMIGEVTSRTGATPFGGGYAEIGRIRYLDDAGYANARYPSVYGFASTPGVEPLYENWMCMVQEPGHETSTATAVVMGLGNANGNSTLYGISVNSTNARGSSLNNPYYSPIYSDPSATGWQQLLRITGKDVFIPQLSSASSDKFLAYNTANGRITYTNGAGNSSITVQDEGSTVVSSTSTFNFVGAGVTASNVGGIATITVSSSGITGVLIKDEGANVVTSANTLNFVGTGVTASNVGGIATITIPAGITSVLVKDEGINVATSANTFNFVGSGVTTSNVGGVATINIPGGSGITGILIKDEGSNVVTSANTINFVGNGIVASNVAGVATITVDNSGISGVLVKDEGANIVTGANTLNFVGAGVVASNVAGVATVTIPGGITGVLIKDEGTNVVTSANTFNFVGLGVTASNVSGVATITIPYGGGGISGVLIKDEGVNVVTSANTINFVGSGVTTSNVGGVATVNIPAGGGGPAGNTFEVQLNSGTGTFSASNKFYYTQTGGMYLINSNLNLTNQTEHYTNWRNTANASPTWKLGAYTGPSSDNQAWELYGPSNKSIFTVYPTGNVYFWGGFGGQGFPETATANAGLVIASDIRFVNGAGTDPAAGNNGIYFADSTYQYTAATTPAVQDEGSNVVAKAATINFVGAGVTASNVGGVATITIPGSSGGDSIFNKGNVSGNTEIYLPYGSIQTCTLIGNTNFDVTSVTSAKSLTLLITQGTGGNKFATFGTSTVKWAVGYNTLSTAAGAVDMVNMVNIGNVYYATLTVGYA